VYRQEYINTSSQDIDFEFIEEKVVYLSIAWNSYTKVCDCIEDIKIKIGIPNSLNDTEEIEFPERLISMYDDILSETTIQEFDKCKFPKYPVIIYAVDPLYDLRILKSSSLIWEYIQQSNDSFFGGLPFRQRLCFQHVSREDIDFMLNIVSSTSRLVVVCNFTLNGKAAEPCDNFGMPFLSYIKIEDDYDTIASRFVKITGDDEILKLRLAVIVDRIPQFFSRSATSENASIFSLLGSRSNILWLGIQRSASSIVSTRKIIGSITIK